jgi:hypothetical protein
VNTALKWIAALLLGLLAWLVMQVRAEVRWASQRIPIGRHRS